MEDIKESLKILASLSNHKALVNKFAREKYMERFSDMIIPAGSYRYYSGYDIISENKIRIEYTYGAGDMDFNDYFYVEI